MFVGVEPHTSLLEKENQDMAQVTERLYLLIDVTHQRCWRNKEMNKRENLQRNYGSQETI
ncbi:hypothetical protein YC2023_065325 [Brassica napus]